MKNLSLFRGWRLLYCFLLYVLSSPAFAISHSEFSKQTQITGTITVDGMPIAGVSISVSGKQLTTVSGENGQYAISAEATDTLIFSYIGFTSVSEPVNGRSQINISLKEDATALQEVTINAGYYSVKEKERTGSIAKIKAADIEKQPVNNPLAAMSGRMSGVNITQASGLPGGGFGIQVRGLNSIRNEGNAPLYVVNGVPFSSQSLGDNTIASTAITGLTNPLNSLNPADIESIEVLKDADATAIYGSRGANGVVLITTKKGKAGETRFNVNAYTTVGKVTRTLDVMDTQQYMAMRTEAFANDGYTEYPDDAFDINGTWDQTRNTDWKKELIGGTAYVHNVQASVSGGSKGTQFLVSGTYRKETTVFPGDAHYGKGAVHSSITHQSPDNRFTLNFSADYAGDKNTLPGVDLTGAAYTLAPNAPGLYDAAGNLNWENGTFSNPLAFLQGSYLNSSQNLVSNAMLGYKILPDLQLKTSLGYNDSRLSQSYTSPTSMYNPFDTSTHEAALYINNGNLKSWIIEPQLDYKKTIGKAAFSMLVGTTFQSQKSSQLAQSGSGFTSDALINSLAAANTVSILNHNVTEYNYNAVYARLNVNLYEKYILNLTGRRDGSSRFGPANQFANFGAVGAAWIFSSESMFKKLDKIISFGKLCTSYGLTGNDQIGDYQFLNTYEVSPYVYDGTVGLTPSRLYNPNFGWETNKKLEAALELGLFKDNIFLTAAWFQNRSSDQLVGVPLPGTTGFASIQSNLNATVQNTGWELDLRTVNFKSKNFSWNTTFNITIPKNELLSFPNLEASTYANSLVVGESIYIRKVFKATGIDPDTGAYTFQDFNGDGIISYDDDRQAIVDTSPKYYGGFGNQLSYKNWAFDFLLQFVKQQGKNYIFTTALPGSFSNLPSEMASHFPADGVTAVSQQYTVGDNGAAVDSWYNEQESTAAFSDASYVRLKSIGISYTLPASWSEKFSGQLYLQGQNLLTFTHFRGADPENQSTVTLPPLRQFTLGFRLNF